MSTKKKEMKRQDISSLSFLLNFKGSDEACVIESVIEKANRTLFIFIILMKEIYF